MLISVIIPVYNIEKYIVRCLKSLTEQDFDPIKYELIIINDGSTDNTLKIIDRFIENNKNKNIQIFSKINGGLSSARNYGMQIAQGDYIWFVDGDDWVSNTSLQELAKMIGENPNLDILEFEYTLATEQNSGFSYQRIGDKNSISDRVESGKSFLEDHEYSLGVTVNLFRNYFLKETGIIFPVGKFSEDNLFSLKTMIQAEKFMKINASYYFYYQRSNSITKIKTDEHLKKYYDDIFNNFLEMRVVVQSENTRIQNTINKMINYFILLMMLDLFKHKKYKLVFYYGKKLKKNRFYPIKEINTDQVSKKFIFFRIFINIILFF